MKYLLLAMLALVTMACAVAEGLITTLPEQFIQVNGVLTLLLTLAFFVVWFLSLQAESTTE